MGQKCELQTQNWPWLKQTHADVDACGRNGEGARLELAMKPPENEDLVIFSVFQKGS